MVEDSRAVPDSFENNQYRNEFVQQFSNLVQKSDEQVCSDGVSYAELNSFVKRSFDAEEASKTLQRIADKKLAEQKARQEAEEAAAAAAAKAKAKAEAKKKAEAEAAAKALAEAAAREE